MGILLGFAPFIVFALLSRFVPASVSLWASAAVSAALVLFALLGLYTSFTHRAWDVPTVRSVIDGGLLLIILQSLLVRRPFTLQYAREQVPAAAQSSATFVRTNYIITAVWALAMAIIVIADLAMHFVTRLPVQVESVAIVGALCSAFWFTKWYPEQIRK
jgi:hypothetical protein